MPEYVVPPTRQCDQVDDYHGTLVADPYRWLEDLNSPETRAWIEAQNDVTFGYLGRLPAQEAIRERLTALWDYPKAGAPFRYGARYSVPQQRTTEPGCALRYGLPG